MDFTPNLNLPIPNPDAVPPKNISDQFPDIALALTMLDEIIHILQGVVAGKAETDHSQAISTITGLVEALAGKMPANATFSLDDLQDVQGAAAALVNYVLVKNASGFWVPSTALAALGVHNHAISEVVGLAELLEDMSDALDLLAANKVEKTITVTGAGLATGGGALAANRVITVAKATEAQAQARSQDDVALTPLTGDKLVAARDALLFHVRDQKASGTIGGTNISGTQTRALNTVVTNGIAGASLSSNKVTLPAGAYHVRASAPGYATGRHRASLRNATTLAVLLVGTSEFTDTTGSVDQTRSFIEGRLELAATTQIELRHFTFATSSSSLGLATSDGNPEVYSELFIWKVD